MSKETLNLINWIALTRRLTDYGMSLNKALHYTATTYSLNRRDAMRLIDALKK